MSKGLTRRRVLAATAAASVASPALARRPGGGAVSAPPPIPVINSSLSASGTQGSPFSYTITATNSPTSFNASGLPAPLTINTSSGVISGTPTVVGFYSVGLSATNTAGTGSATLSLNIMAPAVTTNFVTSVTNLGASFPTGVAYPVGMAITVGAQPLTLTQVGRYMNAGDFRTHTIAIFDAARVDGFTVPGGIATINMAGGTPGTFVYGTLQGPTKLNAGGTYYIMSMDAATGDQLWSPVTCVVTADAALIGGAGTGGGYPLITVTGGPNTQHVPLDFKYTVGSPAVQTIVGSSYTGFGGNYGFRVSTGLAGPVSGSILLQASWYSMFGTLAYQWLVFGQGSTSDAVLKSPVLTWNNWAPTYVLDWTLDTTLLPNGTYIIYPQPVDWGGDSCEKVSAQGSPLIIANSGLPASIAAGQVVPFAPKSVHGENPRPDYLTYDGVPNPIHATYPIAYTFIAPGIDPSAPGVPNNPSLRNSAKWYGEVQPGPRNIEYYGAPQWATSVNGGVVVQYNNPLENLVTDVTSYNKVVKTNTMDGTRLNALVSPYSNFVENPDISGEWWGAELGGRIFKITRAGTTITVYGPVRNKAVLTLSYDFTSTGVDDQEAIQSFVGTPPPADMDGANDICFDPRDHNILYVACQLEHWIAKINLTTLVATVYAGIPGTAGYHNDANPALATFNQPSSIIMDSSGVMYVCDRENAAIRKITAAGAVSTLIGSSVSPAAPPTAATMTALGAGHAVSGNIVWNTGTQSAPLTLTTPASFVLGQALTLTGSANSGGPDVNYTSSPNFQFVVTAGSGANYTIKWMSGNPPAIGTLTGTMTMYEFASDIYSPPGTVALSAASAAYPNWIRFASPGPTGGATAKIVFGEAIVNNVRLIDLGASTVRRIGSADSLLEQDPGGAWFWGDVDYAGTCGPVDDIFAWKVQTGPSAAHYTWRMSLAPHATIPGKPLAEGVAFGDAGQFGLPSYGPIDAIEGGEGHYPWAVALSRVEGRLISGGVADWHAVMIRIKQPSDPDVAPLSDINFNQAIWNAGIDVHISGTAKGFPFNSRPSFEALHGKFGGTFIGNGSVNTFEDMWGLSDSARTAFIQGGMGGMVPRPEITGNDLRNLKYFALRTTMQGGLGPTPVQPGPADPDVTPPVFLTLSTTRLSSTSVQVSYTTSEPTIGFAGAGSATQAITFGYYPMWSAIESVFSASHVNTITVPSGMTPVHVTAVTRDHAGNIVHTADLAVT